VTIGLNPDDFAAEDGIMATAHASGEIQYPDGATGMLVVIKLGLTDDSPQDLLDRRRTDRFFPHHPTFPFQVFRRDRMDAYRLSGTQIHPSCCAGVFVDQSAESVASVEVVSRVRTDEAWARPWYRWCQPESAMRPVGVVVVDVDT
jgi:hypothetical protein